MEKLIYVLRQPEESATDEWAERIRAAATAMAAETAGLTVAVHDDAVRGATLRLRTMDPPAAGIVSVWVQQSYGHVAERVGEALAEITHTVNGYLVTESVPLPPPTTAPGARTEGFANIALLRRPTDMTFAAWRQDWQGRHTQAALELQSTTGYEQNLVVRPLTPDSPEIAAIVLEQFPASALTDPMVWYDATDQSQLNERVIAMYESVKSFGADRDLDTVSTSRYEVKKAF